MTVIHDILCEECISLNLGARKKTAVIEELVELLLRAGKVADKGALTAELLERERTASTGIGQGIAIPHRITERVSTTLMAVGRSPAGVAFDAIDKKPVHLFFLILGPPGNPAGHLKLLSRLSRLLLHGDLHRQLMDAPTGAAVLELLREQETA